MNRTRLRPRRLLLVIAPLSLLTVVSWFAFWSARSNPESRIAREAQTRARALLTADVATGTMRGRVLDANERPATGARVLAIWEPLTGGFIRRPRELAPASEVPPIALADARGEFAFDQLPPGTYLLTATAQGQCAATAGPFALGPGAVLSELTLRLGKSDAVLSGRTLDAGGGALASARIRAVRVDRRPNEPEVLFFEAVSASEGHYELGLPAGRYALAVEADGYAPADDLVDVRGSERLDFRLQPAARIAGRVVTPDGEGVAEAELRIEAVDPGTLSFARVTSTDRNGQFAAGGLRAGAYRLLARKDELVGSASMAVQLAVAAVRDDLIIELRPGARLEGTVKDLRGRGIADASVWVVQDDLGRGQTPQQRQVSSNARGSFRIPGILPGSYRVRAQATGFASREQVLILPKPGRASLDIVLDDEAAVVGVVRDEAGAPVSQVFVRARVMPARGGPLVAAEGKTDAGGRFRLAGLTAGDLQVTARSETGIVQTSPQKLVTGETKRIELRLETGARLSGTVTWDDGQPAANVIVVGQSRTRAITHVLDVRTDEGGGFTVGPLPAGDVSVHPIATDQRGSTLWPRDGQQINLALKPGEHNRGIRLSLARRNHSLRGSVRGPDGKPVADAVVRAEKERDGITIPDNWASSAVTAPDGTFVIEALAEGLYTVTASHPSYPDARERGLATASSGPARLVFADAASVAGTVVTAAGQPVTSFSLLVSEVGRAPGPMVLGHPLAAPRPATRVPHEVRSQAGEFAVGKLGAGTYTLTAIAPDGASATFAKVVLGSGEKRGGLRLVVAASRAISIEVRDFASDVGIAGAIADLRLPGGASLTAVGDQRGRIRLENVPRLAGLTLRVRAPVDDYLPEVRPVADTNAAVDLGVVRLVKQLARDAAEAIAQVHFMPDGDRLVVARLVPESSGTKAGFRPGDELVAVDGRDARGVGATGIMNLLAGPANSAVTLTVKNGGEPPREVRVPRTAMR